MGQISQIPAFMLNHQFVPHFCSHSELSTAVARQQQCVHRTCDLLGNHVEGL